MEYGPCHSIDESTCLHKVQFLILNKVETQTLRLGPDENIAINGQKIIPPYVGKDFKIYGDSSTGLVVELIHLDMKLLWKHTRSLALKVILLLIQ